MNVNKLTAIAVMSIASIGIAAGTANAQPASLSTVNGSDHGIGYHVQLSSVANAVTTTVDAGSFALSQNASSVTLSDGRGAPVAEIPLSYRFQGAEVSLTPFLGDSGRSLTLTPASAPATVIAAQDISSQSRFIEQLQRASTGAAVGAVIGGAIGLLFFGIGIVPGVIIGAAIGLVAAGGQPLADAAIAYFSGQP